MQGYIYILHFESAFWHARHYVGATCDIRARMAIHASGLGARIVGAAKDRGVGFQLGAIGACDAEEMYGLERKVKDRKGGVSRLCEVCNPGTSRSIPGCVSVSITLVEGRQVFFCGQKEDEE